MKEHAEQMVRDLREGGYAFMPIDIDLLESAESSARIFLLSQRECWADWNFTRNDGTEVGIIEERPSQAGISQTKVHALAFAHDLSRRRAADNPHTKACLGAVTELYRDMRRRVFDLCVQLDKHCGCADVVGRVRNTFELGEERATSLLLRTSVCGRRSLTNALQSEGVLSIFFGNDRNEIWLKDIHSDRWLLRSPPYGMGLVFFGLGVTELNNPEFKSSLYRVDAHDAKSVCATIMHVQMKAEAPTVEVSDNVETLRA